MAVEVESASAETVIRGWLTDYLHRIEQPVEVDPLPNGWVAVPCPEPANHLSDPRSSPPTFAVNVASGACRCSVCGKGGSVLALQRAMQNYIPGIGEAKPSRRDFSKFVPVSHGEFNIAGFPCDERHYYRDEKGTAYCAAMFKPAFDQNHEARVVYAKRRGEMWTLGLPDARLFYQYDLLTMNQVRLIFIVSDELSCDLLQGELGEMAKDPEAPDGAATTWMGSDHSWRNTEGWTDMAAGGNIVLWPDQRQRSINTMLSIADVIAVAARNVWFVDIGRSALPEGTRPADALLEGASIFDIVGQFAVKVDADGSTRRRLSRNYEMASA